MESFDAVIVGGGCMGASVAYHLARLGITQVALLERATALGTGSTGRNAGGVRHQFSHAANVKLSIESIAFFERFEEVCGTPIDFHQDGYLFLISRDDHLAAFRRNVELQRRLGVDVDWLGPDGIRDRAPGVRLDGVLGATFCARDGICDPNGVTMGFAQAAQRMGVEIRRRTTVTGIRVEGGRVTGVDTDGGALATPVVINAAGPWAASIADLAGVSIPIVPLRRHIFIAQPPAGGWAAGGPDGAPAAPATRIMVIDFDSTFYCHREGANLLFGMGDPDEQPGFDTTVNWQVLEKITPVATARLPALADAAIARAWAGLYEMTPDAMPIIGPTGPAGLHTIAGFSGHGFQHAPAAGRILADLVAGRDPEFDLSPFAVERFAEGAKAGEGNVV